jgi:ribosomal protein S17E
MMDLRQWQHSKIFGVSIDFSICKDNVLSNYLLEILDLPAGETDAICKQVATSTSALIKNVMEGLAKKQMQVFSNHENFEFMVTQLTNLHSNDIRGMVAQVLEKIFVQHKEQKRVDEVKKLIHSAMFLKSVVICSCEV